ncbi:hypothetical protein LV83_03705 [Algoriphagus yeomjeoni]|uniref:Uncharacterized protein n=1 Tax=Algoriphagus yeomjeoni TaxID=291403 RepID=A0A327P3I0_9BACT|nr:hypothetical protein LV83_03705 [Algoriphagus yeomjeoni]
MLLGSCFNDYKKFEGVILDLRAVNGPKVIGFRTVYEFQYFDSGQLDTIEIMDKRVYLLPGDSIQIEIDHLDKLDHRVLKILYRAPRH